MSLIFSGSSRHIKKLLLLLSFFYLPVVYAKTDPSFSWTTLGSAHFLVHYHQGEEALARLVTEHAGKARRVADLFTGIGTFALRLAENAQVAACDSEPAAIKALQQAAGKASGLKPIEAQTRDLFRRPFMAS